MNAINPNASGGRLVGATPLPSQRLTIAGEASPAKDAGSFKNLLLDSIENVNGMQQQADQAVEALFTGGDVNPAEVLTAVQKADMAFRLTMQVRNKLMDVYREIQDVRI
ncbi:flagellar hook-basal body protein FliE [Botrimarina colliarenosi]|uniref:Flagellar hook-basal body complex protein FliE n=1 Tax=Botrimarina colliarenosi TaxID=2528001 RepID=A0A5C6AQ58_9BACT|nr:flagellar hook-basal body complex protein FliE [Botrimarina colliarenosi]TWU00334.1 flagellar hook-basal body protein FliE [Botrimarina colliarenosi]